MHLRSRSPRWNSETVRRFREKKVLCVICCNAFFIVLQFFSALPLQAVEIPSLTGRVNDYASMISAEAELEINEKLAHLEKSESTQIAVLTVESLDGEPLEDFSIRVAEEWKIGQREFDNGVLLLVAKKERKVRIEVGYGLEGALTDLTAGRIADNEIVPLFAEGRFDEGFIRGTDLIIAAVQGEYTAPAEEGAAEEDGRSLLPFIFVLLLIIYFYSQVPRGGGGGHGSGPLIYTGGPGSGGFGRGGFSSGSGSFGGGGGGFGGGGASGSW